jgi:hypothetical protein
MMITGRGRHGTVVPEGAAGGAVCAAALAPSAVTSAAAASEAASGLTSVSYRETGGPSWIRTMDLMLIKHAL